MFAFVLFREEERRPIVERRGRRGMGSAWMEGASELLTFTANIRSCPPAGLAFFQSDYETSLRDFFHNTLDMKESRYEYESP
jgi:large subunit ribosomal protein L38